MSEREDVMDTNEDTEKIKSARGKFFAMVSTYFFSVFNDNFFKQSALLLAVRSGMNDAQGLATMIFTIPYLFIAAPAGWFADRFPKRNVVIGVKILELVAMSAGALGMLCLEPGEHLRSVSWFLILTMVGLMGAHASLFSPALNGSIPELYPHSYVVRANGIIKLVSTLAILMGIAVAGVALDSNPHSWIFLKLHAFKGTPMGQTVVAVTVILIALAGLGLSLYVPKFKAAGTSEHFPWMGPLYTIKSLYSICKDSLLNLCIWGNTFFWFAGAIMVLMINEMGPNQFGLSNTTTSGLVVSEMLGVGIGAMLASKLARGDTWYRILWKALLGMGLSLFLITFVPWLPQIGSGAFSLHFIVLFLLLTVTGIFGGIYLIPIESFIQIRPAPDRKGMVIAAANFVALCGVLLSGAVYWGFAKMQIKPTNCFLILSVLAFLATVLLYLSILRYEKNNPK